MSMSSEQIVKNAADTLFLHLKTELTGHKDLARQIAKVFELELLAGDPQADQNMRDRTKALLELARLDAVQYNKEVILSSVVTAVKIVSSVLLSV